jgi:hypothetical protein
MKVGTSLILILAGCFVIAMWAAGSHGHLRFRIPMAEDWVMLSLIVLTLGLGSINIIKAVYRRIR